MQFYVTSLHSYIMLTHSLALRHYEKCSGYSTKQPLLLQWFHYYTACCLRRYLCTIVIAMMCLVVLRPFAHDCVILLFLWPATVILNYNILSLLLLFLLFVFITFVYLQHVHIMFVLLCQQEKQEGRVWDQEQVLMKYVRFTTDAKEVLFLYFISLMGWGGILIRNRNL